MPDSVSPALQEKAGSLQVFCQPLFWMPSQPGPLSAISGADGPLRSSVKR